ERCGDRWRIAALDPTQERSHPDRISGHPGEDTVIQLRIDTGLL
ncbi:hypothetical protein ABIA94_009463, partial [Bradyrhizobium sp. LA7.1]